MDELKNKVFILGLTDEDTASFIKKCYRDGTTPAEVLEGFINDLVYGTDTRGSDEQMLAGKYYERCGYGFLFPGEYRTFTQWLLIEDEMEDVIDALIDIDGAKHDIEIMNAFDELGEEGEQELEEAKGVLVDCYAKLHELHGEYKKQITKADEYEDAMKNVHEYMETMRKATEGGVI